MKNSNGATFHSNKTLLFVFKVVHYLDFACLLLTDVFVLDQTNLSD